MDLAEYAANQSKQFLLLVPWCQHFLGKENRRYKEGDAGGRRKTKAGNEIGANLRPAYLNTALFQTPT